MKQRNFKLNPLAVAVLFAISSPLAIDSAHAGPGWADSLDLNNAPIKVPTYYANSPSGLRPDMSPTAAPGAMIDTGAPLRKFVDSLPGLGAPNNLGQYIPIAVSDTASYPGSDYYELGIVEYTEKMHSDLPKATTLRGYVQLETPANAATSKHIALKYPNGSFIRDANGNQIFAVDNPHYLGPLILANRHVPVRIKYSNLLPKGRYNAATGRNGDLFLPVDTTLPGAGLGPDGINSYTQNRAEIHLHGGDTPWISDGTPHQWITPAGEITPYKKGVSFRNVPDMPDPGPGSGTLYYPNGDSARLMFYHDHTFGLTRVNVYGGEAAGYLLVDPVEQGLVASGAVPAAQIPLVIQDKTFVPADIAQQDAKWSTAHWGQPGDLWFPHVYEPNQNVNTFDGTNPAGRWDYGPLSWPMTPVPLALPTGDYGNASTTPEAFMDTPVVNGTAYPTLTVQPQAYRFRILSAGNDRFLNLGLYKAEPLTIALTNAGSGYTAAPAVTITGNGTGATATATVQPAGDISITVTNPGTGYTTAPTVTIAPPPAGGTAATAVASVGTEVKMVTVPMMDPATNTQVIDPVTLLPLTIDIPDPAAAGPDIIQIGSEGGLLPAPVVKPSTPFTFAGLTTSVASYGLYLAGAERADAVIDFSGYCPGTKFILYNDAPAPVPGGDPRYDYYTGNLDQTAVGGAPSTLPGYGPNTRTVMQIVVAGAPNPVCTQAAFTIDPNPTVKNPTLAALQTALPVAYAASQPKPIVAGSAYSGLWGATYTDPAVSLELGSTLQPNFSFTDPTTGLTTSLPVQNKAILEQFDPNYGRLNATLGVGLPFTSSLTRATIPLAYIDPATETFADGETQIWKVTHTGVDTHPVHFHLVNVQVINRIGWDGTVKPPESHELGWKETLKMNPLEDVMIAVRPKQHALPFGLPNSVRPLDPSQPLNSALGFTQVDPATGNPAVVNNTMTNFGWEYVWHCHILGHEENDFMRPFVLNSTVAAPGAPNTLGVTAAGVLSWADPTPAATSLGNSSNEIGFRIRRATLTNGVPGAYSIIGTAPANATSYTDASAVPGTAYAYRVAAFNTAGVTTSNAVTNAVVAPMQPPAVPNLLIAKVASATQVNLSWRDNSTDEQSFAVWRSVNGGAATQIGTTPARGNGQRAATGVAVAFVDNGASVGQTYAYYVTAVNAAGTSNPSNTASATVPTVPAAPSGLSATAVRNGLTDNVALTWTDNANSETSFRIQSKTSVTTWANVTNTAAANSTTHTQMSVPRQMTYRYRIQAVNAAGSSAWSNIATVITP